MNVTSYITKDYENKPPILAPKKRTQFSKRQKPIQTSLPKGIMKKTTFSGSDKTNPIQTQTKPISKAANNLYDRKEKSAKRCVFCGNFINFLRIFIKFFTNFCSFLPAFVRQPACLVGMLGVVDAAVFKLFGRRVCQLGHFQRFGPI